MNKGDTDKIKRVGPNVERLWWSLPPGARAVNQTVTVIFILMDAVGFLNFRA